MSISSCRRVVLVVLDGLRPDAIDAFDLSHLRTLELVGASTRSGSTVSPPVTAAAMGSLLTGVHPSAHGLTSDRFHIPHSAAGVVPLPSTLRRAGFTTSAFLAQPPLLYRRLGRALAVRLGVDRPCFVGRCAEEIVAAAEGTFATQRSGLMILHLPDADVAGHAWGWMSREYGIAARQLDAAVGAVMRCTLEDIRDSLLVVCADHGGGGQRIDDHESSHPLDMTIPILLAGSGVAMGTRLDAVNITDIPATILAALRVPQPASYVGCPLTQAFTVAAAAA